MKALEWGLRTSSSGAFFELQEGLVGVLIWSAPELAPLGTEYRLHSDPVLLEERQHAIVQHLQGRQRKPAGMAAVAVQDGLEVSI